MDISEATKQGQEYLEAIREESLEKLGYFLLPSELFKQVAKRGNGNGKEQSNFIIEDIQKILINIQNSTMGTDSEEDFDHLFEDMDLNSTKLGKTAEQRNEVIVTNTNDVFIKNISCKIFFELSLCFATFEFSSISFIP